MFDVMLRYQNSQPINVIEETTHRHEKIWSNFKMIVSNLNLR